MTNPSLICDSSTKKPAGVVADICGVRMADTDAACRIFYYPNHSELKQDIKRGLPHIKVRNRYFFPIDLCRRWYTGNDVKSSIDGLKRMVHRADAELPKEQWFRKVDDYDGTNPWNA